LNVPVLAGNLDNRHFVVDVVVNLMNSCSFVSQLFKNVRREADCLPFIRLLNCSSYFACSGAVFSVLRSVQCVSNCLRRGRVSAEGQEGDPQSAHLLADGMTQVLRDGIAACVIESRTANVVLSV
jgi:hypothetical protein